MLRLDLGPRSDNAHKRGKKRVVVIGASGPWGGRHSAEGSRWCYSRPQIGPRGPGSDRFRAVSCDFGRPCADRVDKPPKQPPLALRRRVTPRRGGAGNPGACQKRSRRGRIRCSTRPQANQLCDRVGQKMLTFCVFSGASGWSDSFSAAETAPLRTRTPGAC